MGAVKWAWGWPVHPRQPDTYPATRAKGGGCSLTWAASGPGSLPTIGAGDSISDRRLTQVLTCGKGALPFLNLAEEAEPRADDGRHLVF